MKVVRKGYESKSVLQYYSKHGHTEKVEEAIDTTPREASKKISKECIRGDVSHSVAKEVGHFDTPL